MTEVGFKLTLEQLLERISDLNNYQGLILMWTFFNNNLSHTDTSSLLNRPGHVKSILFDGQIVDKEFLLSILNAHDLSDQ